MIQIGSIDNSLPNSKYIYYIGGKDPSTGLLVKERIIVPGMYHLVELSPPPILVDGWESAQIVSIALGTGALKGRKKTDISKWIDGQKSLIHKMTAEKSIASIRDFLQGAKLEDANIVLKTRYKEWISRIDTLAALSWISILDKAKEEIWLVDDMDCLLASTVQDMFPIPSFIPYLTKISI